MLSKCDLLCNLDNDIKFHQDILWLLIDQRYAIINKMLPVCNNSTKTKHNSLREKLKKYKTSKPKTLVKKTLNLKTSKPKTMNVAKLNTAIGSFGDEVSNYKHIARSGLWDDQQKKNKIRAREAELIKSGVLPIDAKNQTQLELYPSSLNINKKKSHALLAIRDSSDDDDIETSANTLFNTPLILKKLETMGIIENHENYNSEDIIDEVVIFDG
jgi:hypothetical protein